jgi:hypothetical protein
MGISETPAGNITDRIETLCSLINDLTASVDSLEKRLENVIKTSVPRPVPNEIQEKLDTTIVSPMAAGLGTVCERVRDAILRIKDINDRVDI